LFYKKDSNKQSNKAKRKIASSNTNTLPRLMTRCDTLDQGTNAFMQWLSCCSQDKQSYANTSNNPIIILKEFVSNKYSILYDNNIGKEVIVKTYNGVPRCNTCNVDDCGHVGFTICLEQKYDNEGTVFD
jgi:hypothetical protein